jgi:hypothetical protein
LIIAVNGPACPETPTLGKDGMESGKDGVGYPVGAGVRLVAESRARRARRYVPSALSIRVVVTTREGAYRRRDAGILSGCGCTSRSAWGAKTSPIVIHSIS